MRVVLLHLQSSQTLRLGRFVEFHGVMFQVLHYLSGQTNDSAEDGQPLFSLSDPLRKGSSVFREVFRGQSVALKVLEKRRPDEFLSQLLQLDHRHVIRYLDCVSVEQPVARSLVIMELCQGSLATYLNGPMDDVRLEAAEFAWQLSSGLDYLHANKMMACLEPERILLASESIRHAVKLQVDLEFHEYSLSAEREAGELFAVAELACLVFDSPNSDPVADDSAMLFQRFIDHLQHLEPSKRPRSIRLIVYHPLFVLTWKEARHRLVDLAQSECDFVNSITVEQLDTWNESMDNDLRKLVASEDVSKLVSLVEQFSEDGNFTAFLKHGRHQVPLLVTHFIYHLMAPSDVGVAPLPSGSNVQPPAVVPDPPAPPQHEESDEDDALQFNPTPADIQPVVEDQGIKLLHLIRSIEDLNELKSLSTDLSPVDAEGRSILHLAAEFNPLGTVSRFLIDCGMNLKAVDSAGHTPLHLAAEKNNAEVVAVLLHCGADVNALDAVGRTPLHLAARSNTKLEVVERLLQAGADPKAADSEGKIPLQLARENGNKQEIVDLLNSYEEEVECFGLPGLAEDVIRRILGCLPCNIS